MPSRDGPPYCGIQYTLLRLHLTWPFGSLWHSIPSSFLDTCSSYVVKACSLCAHPTLSLTILVFHTSKCCVFRFISFFKLIYLFLERAREREREGEKHRCVVASCAPPTGDLASNPGTCPDWESNRRPFGSQPVLHSLSHPSQGWLFFVTHISFLGGPISSRVLKHR